MDKTELGRAGELAMALYSEIRGLGGHCNPGPGPHCLGLAS